MFFPDNLDGGISALTPVTRLIEPLTLTGTQIFVSNMSPLLFEGAVIQINEEKMLITFVNATSTFLRVQRGHLFSKQTSHMTVSGGDHCSCDITNGNATGGTLCSCVFINAVQVGATTPSQIGIDLGETGHLGKSCRMGAPAGEGCNPIKYEYFKNLRTHQTADIIGGASPGVMSVSGTCIRHTM